MSSSELNQMTRVARRRRSRKSYALLVLAAGILAFGVAAGALFWAMRPVTLSIAVGPSGSEGKSVV